jgi:hypothetical protein
MRPNNRASVMREFAQNNVVSWKGGVMPKHTAFAAAGYVLVTALAFGATGPADAAECLTAPDSAAPGGQHWYYRFDRATKRKCWYLREAGLATRPAEAPKTSRAASSAAEKPAPKTAPASKSSQEALFREFLEWQKTQGNP